MAVSSLHIDVAGQQKQIPKPLLLETAKLLTLSREELAAEIRRQLDENPFLLAKEVETAPLSEPIQTPFDEPVGVSADFPGTTSLITWKNTPSEDLTVDPTDFLSYPTTLLEHLTRQIRLLTVPEDKKDLVQWLAGNLNEDGLFEETLESMASTCPISASEKDWQEALKTLQSLDPTGVGATSALEVLSLQLKAAPNDAFTATRELADFILKECPDLLLKGDKAAIARRLHRDENDVRAALCILRSLNPHPCSRFAGLTDNAVLPDFTVEKKDGVLTLIFQDDAAERLVFDAPTYALLHKEVKQAPEREAMEPYAQKARLFISALTRRKKTLLLVGRALFKRQSRFFAEGPQALVPLGMQEVAESLGISKSTVSRAVAGKFIQTPFGFFPLKHFFSGTVPSTDAPELLSSTVVRERIRQLIAEENPACPMSDAQLTQQLAEQGIRIARRTVAKYREMDKIPPKNERLRL